MILKTSKSDGTIEKFANILNSETACERVTKEFEDNLESRLSTLTEKERDYFMLMHSKSGVLYIKSKPGIAKSQKAKAIATKLGMRYLDIRLSMIDETDVGLFPDKSSITVNGITYKFLEHIITKWAFEANMIPTLIHFEELNRASLPVRNAALQLLLERCVGTAFEFNDNVYMMSSGNLGDEDGTDVEEFDAALNNRLIHVEHDLTFKEWVDDFAKDNVCPQIIKFLDVNPDMFYQPPTSTSHAYATARSWTFLSDYIKANFSKIELTLSGSSIIPI